MPRIDAQLWHHRHALRWQRVGLPFFATVIVSLVAAFGRATEPPITAVTFAPDGGSVIVASQAGIELREWPSLEPYGSLPTELPDIHDVAFAPDGTRLAVAGGTPADYGSVELYTWPDGKLLYRKDPHDDLIYGVAWRSDSQAFATAALDQTTQLHDAASGERSLRIEGHSRGVLSVAYLPGDELLISGSIDQSLRVWDIATGEGIAILNNHTAEIQDVAVRPGDSGGPIPMVASAALDRTVRLWQPTLPRLVRWAKLPSAPLAIAWTPDGRRIAASCVDGHLRLIDPDTVEVVFDTPAIDGWAYCLAIAPDGTAAVVGGSNGRLRGVTLPPPAVEP